MVSTTEILPCPALQSFVRCYTLRQFDTGSTNFIKPLPANHELTFSIILSGSISAKDNAHRDIILSSRAHIIGLQTGNTGCVVFNGNVKLFNIQFRPDGFYQLFGIPSNLITDKVYKADEIIEKGLQIYKERLNEAVDLTAMKNLTDEFLLAHLITSKANNPENSITNASAYLFKNAGNVNIKKLAYDANLSLRSFELKFTRQVGLPPKLFARITRFNYAILIKIQNPLTSWTKISHKCGYYDQMHFIKEFRQFAGSSPVHFYKNTPLPSEDYKKQ